MNTSVRTLALAALRTRPRRALIALFVGAVWGGQPAHATQALAGEPASPPVVAVSTDTDVHEATLRYMFANHGATGMDAYCVSTGAPDANNDPDPALLSRFAGNQPPVVPYSSCTISISGDTYNPTGGPAQWFSLGAPTIDGRQAVVNANWHINGRLAEFYRCTLRLAGRTWRVRECVLVGAA